MTTTTKTAPAKRQNKVAGKPNAKSASKAPAKAATTPPTSEVNLAEEFRTRLDVLRDHAVTCGRLDCGHLYKSDSRAVRRAVILYTAENAGQGLSVNLDAESPEVVAVMGVLRAAKHASPKYARKTAPTHAGITLVWPTPDQIKMTKQRVEVFTYLLQGFSATDISSDPNATKAGKPAPRKGLTERTIETVKSHAGYLRRETNAHDAVSALLCLVKAGKLTDKSIKVG